MHDCNKSPVTLPWKKSGGLATADGIIGSIKNEQPVVQLEENILETAPSVEGLSPTLFSGKGQQMVRDLLMWAGHRCGMEDFSEHINVVWNCRFTTTCGRATFKNLKIELAAKPWTLLDAATQREAILHEACHLFVHEAYNIILKQPITHGHGVEWINMMRLCGFKEPRATMPCPGIVGAKRYIVYCKCKQHLITPQLLGRMKKGMVFYCGECDTNVRPEPYG